VTIPDLALLAIGAVISLVTSLYFFRLGAARSKIVIGMALLAHIDPSTAGVLVKMKVGSREVTNLLLLEVIVTNRGPHDILVTDADDVAKHPLRPRIELPFDVRALADPWNPDGSLPAADVRLARRLQDDRQVVFVHIHRLAKGATSRARILCTYQADTSSPAVEPGAMRFFPGFMPGVDIQAAGLLRRPARLLKR
jgi:hypothetical protein